jgi:hypothetical protein
LEWALAWLELVPGIDSVGTGNGGCSGGIGTSGGTFGGFSIVVIFLIQ